MPFGAAPAEDASQGRRTTFVECREKPIEFTSAKLCAAFGGEVPDSSGSNPPKDFPWRAVWPIGDRIPLFADAVLPFEPHRPIQR